MSRGAFLLLVPFLFVGYFLIGALTIAAPVYAVALLVSERFAGWPNTDTEVSLFVVISGVYAAWNVFTAPARFEVV